jgi:hypothetical protein
MHLPVDELLVFTPIALLALAYGGRKLFLAVKYRHVP